MRDAKQKARLGPAARAWWLWPTLVAALTAGCANDRGPHPDLPRIGLGAAFTSRNMCGLGVSPAIRVISPPGNAAQYRLKMTMVNALVAPSWEFDIPVRPDTVVDSTPRGATFREQTIREGAIANFEAPCAPERQVYSYRLEAMAMGPDGRPLAYGWGFVSAQSLTRQLNAERAFEQRQQLARNAAAARGLPPPVQPPPSVLTNLNLPYMAGSGYPPEVSAYFFVY